ncbi:MAG TPA: DUF899 family protein [Caulobacteraceae bacterium]|jgi:predicted dithiol-disulfide oxidoreductase (DUF899 family)|nr:DUF899 family protein [Caulobacteraceae bacterium]
MDAKTETLMPAARLAAESPVRIPHESAEYRAARTALLAEEIELRRQIERVAEKRRALPPGGRVDGDYRFATEDGETDLAGLFAGKETLAIFSYMFGPQRKRPCPMCTNMLDSWDGNAADLAQHLSLVVVARSPLETLLAWKRERGWKHLRLVSDLNDAFSRDYGAVQPDGSENGVLSIFTRRDGSFRHFWSNEMSEASADPGQDVRGVAETYAPLWHVLDATPEGRKADWYPSLTYA